MTDITLASECAAFSLRRAPTGGGLRLPEHVQKEHPVEDERPDYEHRQRGVPFPTVKHSTMLQEAYGRIPITYALEGKKPLISGEKYTNECLWNLWAVYQHSL